MVTAPESQGHDNAVQATRNKAIASDRCHRCSPTPVSPLGRYLFSELTRELVITVIKSRTGLGSLAEHDLFRKPVSTLCSIPPDAAEIYRAHRDIPRTIRCTR